MPNLPELAPSAGPAFAVAAAALWAVSPMFMASAGRRVGSFPVVLLRSLLASLMLAAAVGIAALLTGRSPALPTYSQAGWLAVSGLIGMGVGDVLIYEAFVTLGPRRTTQALVLAPPVAVVTGWAFLGEAMSARTLVGIALVLAATLYAVLAGQRRTAASGQVPGAPAPAAGADDDDDDELVIAGGESGDVETLQPLQPTSAAIAPGSAGAARGVPRRDDGPAGGHPVGEPGHVSVLGLLCAVGGAVCMGAGAVTGRQAFRAGPAIDPVVATLLRVVAAGTFLWLAPVARCQVGQTLALLRDRHVLTRVGVGTLLGPFVGMFCYVAALRSTPAGLVSTLVATSPLFAIPITMLRYRTRIGWDVCLAALAAAAGVATLLLG